MKNKKIAILGWGIDTQDVVPYLLKNGAQITVFDQAQNLNTKYTHEINWLLEKDNFGDLSKFDLIIRSPGVYRYRPEIIAAEKAGVEISSKIKLFFDLCPGKIIGVTGTKGKGTTSTLIYEILKNAEKKVFLGGNIGSGIFSFLPELDTDSWIVLELSSFQLIDLTKSPHISVVLMTTVEHLNWHVSPQEYIDAKKNIVSHQTKSDYAIVNNDYPNSVEIGKVATGQVIWISRDTLSNLQNSDIGLIGPHNRENVAAALTVAHVIGVSEEIIRSTIKNFKGLEHRLEKVGTVNGVTFYNDSFSTTPETTIAAINAFSEPIIIIVGGSDKGSDYTELGKLLASRSNIKAVILIGLMSRKIEDAILSAKKSMSTKIVQGCKNMSEIVQKAYNIASEGDVVVLSPGAASFDMFKNYKNRGELFKEEVSKLKNAS